MVRELRQRKITVIINIVIQIKKENDTISKFLQLKKSLKPQRDIQKPVLS